MTRTNYGKAPSIQFYYKDWLCDQALRQCSEATRGVWMDLICVSCDMPIPGVFAYPKQGAKIEISDKIFGKFFENFGKISEKKLLEILPGNLAIKKKAFAELKEFNVIGQSPDKTLYVRKIYRDMQLRRMRAESGCLGGNPVLLNQNANQTVNQEVKQNPVLLNQRVNQSANQKPTPSSSSSIPYPNSISNNTQCQSQRQSCTEGVLPGDFGDEFLTQKNLGLELGKKILQARDKLEKTIEQYLRPQNGSAAVMSDIVSFTENKAIQDGSITIFNRVIGFAKRIGDSGRFHNKCGAFVAKCKNEIGFVAVGRML